MVDFSEMSQTQIACLCAMKWRLGKKWCLCVHREFRVTGAYPFNPSMHISMPRKGDRHPANWDMTASKPVSRRLANGDHEVFVFYT